jgi:cytochrome c oxidase subunit 2
LFALLAASGSAFADTAMNLTPGVSPISRDVYELHMTVFWICVVIGILVFGVMFYAMIYHRKSRGAKPAKFHSHPVLEVTWTIVPVIILVVMAIPATKALFNMNNEDEPELTVKITGYQWKWHYEYMEDGVKFFSNLSTPQEQLHNLAPKGPNYLREVDHPLVLPIHKKVRFLITSNDVNHAWWVPALGVKRDAISGFINEAWTKIDKPGTYVGQCAELCGVNHAFMPIVVIATTEQGYKDWVTKQKGGVTQGEADINRAWTMKELMANGEKVYGSICAACHKPTGEGSPPTFPALRGSKIATGPVEGHVEMVMNGKSGTAMQAFKSQLSDVDLASVITFERNSWGNNTGTMVQPIQMKALRDGKSMSEALATKPLSGAALAAATKQAPAAAAAAPTSAPAPAAALPAATPTAAAAAKPASPADALKEAMQRGEKVYQGT